MAFYAYTSITFNYLPKARVLARSLKQHNPNLRFCLLLAEADDHTGILSSDEPFDTVAFLGDLVLDEKEDLRPWVFRHSVVEICTAIKGPYIRQLLEAPDCEGVFYFDPDIAVLHPLDGLLSEFSGGSILLTPHQTMPESTMDGIMDNELCCLRHGVYNLGFLGLKPSAAGKTFADWWSSRLQHFCYSDIEAGLFTDQKWVDLAPAYFDDVRVVRSPAYNVSTWNLTQRTVTGEVPDKLLVNGEPLVFYHFSGFDSGGQLTMLLKYGKNMPALFTLRDWYIRACAQNGQEELGELMWSFATFDNGEMIRPEHRRLYRKREDLQRAFPDPFATGNPDQSYLNWYRLNVK